MTLISIPEFMWAVGIACQSKGSREGKKFQGSEMDGVKEYMRHDSGKGTPGHGTLKEEVREETTPKGVS